MKFMIKMVKRYILCSLKKKTYCTLKKKMHLQNLKWDTYSDEIIKCINKFYICFIRVCIKILKLYVNTNNDFDCKNNNI